MSEQVERKLITMLGHPTESPYGNPIPGLGELGGAQDSSTATENLVNLVDVVRGADSGVTARIRRLGEPAQVDPELLLQLKQAGVFPGSTGSFSAAGSYVAVQIDGFDTGLELPNELAAHIFVDA
jgi:DtxR family Mn-dependent transcriptional regulator